MQVFTLSNALYVCVCVCVCVCVFEIPGETPLNHQYTLKKMKDWKVK
jgi:hypothetical protein